jgi:hypothetical protein
MAQGSLGQLDYAPGTKNKCNDEANGESKADSCHRRARSVVQTLRPTFIRQPVQFIREPRRRIVVG